MTHRIVRRALTTTLITAALAAYGASAAAAGVPQTITHQGRLYDANDKPVNGTLSVVFAIYADSAATVPLWSETDAITFDDGASPAVSGLFDIHDELGL